MNIPLDFVQAVLRLRRAGFRDAEVAEVLECTPERVHEALTALAYPASDDDVDENVTTERRELSEEALQRLPKRWAERLRKIRDRG